MTHDFVGYHSRRNALYAAVARPALATEIKIDSLLVELSSPQPSPLTRPRRAAPEGKFFDEDPQHTTVITSNLNCLTRTRIIRQSALQNEGYKTEGEDPELAASSKISTIF